MKNADALAALDRDLRAVFANRFRSLVVFGAEAAAPDAPTLTLALVDSLSAADLLTCANRVAGWQRMGLATPLLIAADEFSRSLDAFPFEFGAIMADHELVSGQDPFAGLRVDALDMRRACEVQARSHLLHLREGFLEAHGRPDRVAALVAQSAPAVRALLRNVARLDASPEPTAGALARVGELSAGGTISPDEAQRLFPAYLAEMDALVARLDRWSPA